MAKKFEEILSGLEPEDAAVIKEWAASEGDRRVNAGIKTFRASHPTAEDLPERLEAIERKLAEKDDALRQEQLGHYAYRKATEAGVDIALLDGFALADEGTIAAKVLQLKAAVARKKLADVNLEMATRGFKPGGGSGHGDSSNDLRRRRLQGMSPHDAILLESSGQLDKLMGK